MSQTIWITLNQHQFKVLLPTEAPAQVNGTPLAADIRLLAPGVLSLLITLPDGRIRSLRCIADPSPDPTADPAILIDGHRIPYTLSDPRSLRTTSAASSDSGPRPLKSPMPGRIVRVLVANGESVAAGQGCVVIEAMKMQNELKAPRAGTVSRLTASVGDTVASGAVLLIVE
jgi:biotin carboxyl carrier protein